VRAIPQLSLPKICQETHSPANAVTLSVSRARKLQHWPFRIVHPQSHVVGVLNARCN
jgi:hypothetical protein